jgi:putative endopeptidase
LALFSKEIILWLYVYFWCVFLVAPKITSRRVPRGVGRRPPRFSVDYMDPSVDPRQDFYWYAVGNWVKSNPVPADKSSWGAFNELREWNLRLLYNIAKECARMDQADKGSPRQLVGDFYRSGMNVDARERAGFGPIEGLWHTALSVSSLEQLVDVVAKLHRAGVPVLYRVYSLADKKNSSVYALYLVQGGLSMPDREYYLSESFRGVRDLFQKHVERMLRLKGLPQPEAGKWARAVLKVESKIASASRTRVELRDQEKNYNRYDTSRLNSAFPTLGLESYLDAVGVPHTGYIVLGQPEFFGSLDSALHDIGLHEWTAYFAWQVLRSYAPYLHMAAEAEHFRFFKRTLLGQRRMEPRWKRVVEAIDEHIGEALGKLYVEKHFPPEARRRVSQLVDDIRVVFRDRLRSVPWMEEATREQALKKFDRFTAKIGHPERFRDYSGLEVRPDDYAGNVMRSVEFEIKRQASRVGGPVDRDEWFMTPPTVNAYFSPTENQIVFPAGILQPPFFDFEADDAVNYGAIGAVIGHEITHGYDDQGRRYDYEGNLRDWWTPRDAEEFRKRAEEVVKLYSSQEVLPGLYVNGELTLGENIADFGGLSIAYDALQRRLKNDHQANRTIDGLTPTQRFFISYAQIWRQNIREEEIRRRLTVDPHAPAKYRATLPAINHPAFDTAFPPKPTEKASQRPKITIW